MLTLPKARPFEITRPISVSTYDIDYAGHVSNISYFRWLEDMRLQVLSEYCPMDTLMSDGFMPILAGSQIQYKRAIKLFDKPVGHMWIGGITAATMTFNAEIKVEGEVYTIASHQGLFVSVETQKPTRLPSRIVNLYKELV